MSLTVRRLAAVVVLTVVLAPAVLAEIKTIDLRFVPGDDDDAAPTVTEELLGAPVRIAKVSDGRANLPDPAVVGRFLNKDVEVRSDDPVPPFVEDAMHLLFERWSMSVDPASPRVLESEIRMFEIEVNKGAFNANVHLLFRLRDETLGTITYQGVHAGHAGRVGLRSQESNYNRALSNALREAVSKLLSDPAFHDAVLGRAASIVRKVVSPANLLVELSRMTAANVSEETLLAFVREREIEGPFTGDDVASWKEAGIPEAVIREAMARAR